MHIANNFPDREGKRAFGRDLTNLCRGGAVEPKKVGKEKMEMKGKEVRDAINDYHEDIFAYISSFPEKPRKEVKNTEVNEKMKQILIDWLVDVHQSFELKEETLFLAFKYLEEYQSSEEIRKEEYQLVGIACLWIASKYEEIYPPRMKAFVDVTANTYTSLQLKNMESKIISCLSFNLNRITPLSLLNTLQLQPFGNGSHQRVFSAAKYILELSYLNGSITAKYDCKTLAMASIKLAQAICKQQINLGYFTLPLNSSQFYSCYKQMCMLLHSQNKHKLVAIRRKYQKEKYHSVGKISIKADS